MSPQAADSAVHGSGQRSLYQRLIFIDALRVAAVALVIVHHAAQAYGPTGGFWPVHDKAQSAWFLPFYTANAAFGMGLLFLVAGYFTSASVARKGARLFLRERWARIGIPLVSLVLLVHLPALYLIDGRPALGPFARHLYAHGWQPIYLHLWFLAHLMLYSAAFVAWRQLVEGFKAAHPAWPPPGFAYIAGFVAALALITWIARLRYPIDDWVPLLWIMPAEPAHLPQYVALFAAGLAAQRGDWFRKMPTSAGLRWLAVGIIASSGIYLAYALGPWNTLMTAGGFSLASLIRSGWETLIAASLSIGLIVAFREMRCRPSRALAALSAASFGAYILHPAIVVALQVASLHVALPAIVKFAAVSALGTMLSFLLAHLAGKVPVVKAALGASSGRDAAVVHTAD